MLEVEHPSTLTSVSNLALVLQRQGKYGEAETMNRRVLAGRETTLGTEHPDTLTSAHDLAVVLKFQGKYDEAEMMDWQALAGRKRVKVSESENGDGERSTSVGLIRPDPDLVLAEREYDW